MRDFVVAFESSRDREEYEYFGEMEYLFELYEDGVSLGRDYSEQSPIDTRDFTEEDRRESLPPLTPPESPFGDRQRE